MVDVRTLGAGVGGSNEITTTLEEPAPVQARQSLLGAPSAACLYSHPKPPTATALTFWHCPRLRVN